VRDTYTYGVATISRLLKSIGLFCRLSSLSYGYFAKDTHDFKEPTNRSHLIQHMYVKIFVCTYICSCKWHTQVQRMYVQISVCTYADYRLFHRALLQKRPIILRSLLIVATPYDVCIYRYLCVHISGPVCKTSNMSLKYVWCDSFRTYGWLTWLLSSRRYAHIYRPDWITRLFCQRSLWMSGLFLQKSPVGAVWSGMHIRV